MSMVLRLKNPDLTQYIPNISFQYVIKYKKIINLIFSIF